jgi:transmembrane sensor
MSTSLHYSADAEDQAALWAARLEGSTLSAADRTELDAWLESNPTHRVLLSRYCQFSADLEQQLPALVAAGAVTMPEKAPARRSLKLSWLAGGAFATAAAAALVVWLALPAKPAGSFATPVAQRQSLTLADGTRVELNARTNLIVLKTGAERRVRLVEGEAFFTVTKDKAHPFIVETPSGSVRVTGTRFDVRAENVSELEVTVAEGSVQVRPGESSGTSTNDPVALVAGDQLTVGADGVPVKRTLTALEVDNVTAWRQGQVVLDAVPLRVAAAQFARYHGRSITVTPGAANLPISALNSSLDDLDGFLNGLQQMAPMVSVTSGANGAVRIHLKNEP